MPEIINETSADIDPDAPAGSEQLARERAAKQIKARRLFKLSTASAAVGVTLLVPIWAATEYRNAGGWPTRGFGQRSRDKAWNIWIIYPFLAFVLITAGHGWFVYGRKPVPESEINREIDCQAADHHPSGSSGVGRRYSRRFTVRRCCDVRL